MKRTDDPVWVRAVLQREQDKKICRVEAMRAGRPVSRLWADQRIVRIGSARIICGAIGGVWTDESARGQGMATRCLERSLQVMRERGDDAALLFGIPDFYWRWGFAPVMGWPELTLAAREAETATVTRRFHWVRFDPVRHAAAVLRLYEKTEARRSGTAVRPGPRDWRPFPIGSFWQARSECRVALDRRNKVAGYLATDVNPTDVRLTEMGGAAPELFGPATRELARQAAAKRAGEIVLFLPPDHPYAVFLKRMTVRQRQDFQRCGGGMGRLIHLGQVFRKCSTELSRRWTDSRWNGKSLRLDLATDIGRVCLRIRDGKVLVLEGPSSGHGSARSAVHIPQQTLCQLLFGYRSVEDAAMEPDVRIPASLVEPMRALFPPGSPYMWPADRF